MDLVDHGCIRTPIFCILKKGTLEGNFKPAIGFRQGDPLSPYIFIICAGYLGCYLHFMSNIPKSGLGIKVAKEAPKIPYVMFADDCIIFCKATKKVARTIRDILENYKMSLVNSELSEITSPIFYRAGKWFQEGNNKHSEYQ